MRWHAGCSSIPTYDAPTGVTLARFHEEDVMKAPRIQAAMTAVVALAFAASLFAAPAAADRGRGHGASKKRYKGVERVVVVPRAHRTVVVRPRIQPYHSGPSFANLVLAGVIGGVHVSAQFGDAPYRGYGYWDPYCRVRFSSLRAYRHHSRMHDHPYALRVFAVVPGHACDRYCDHGCVDDRTWDRDHGHYDGGRYHDYEDDWDR
jgi:hypothetical protein